MADQGVRLATRIDHGVDQRLRLAATVGGKQLGRFLTELLDAHLPSAGELADRIRNGGTTDDGST